ncbi:MAG TPA: DUF3047 domain-containing protein [Dongiaceae bacterium]|nr:DUF3047 domain-containing protein [Dongiaceae bacterium]
MRRFLLASLVVFSCHAQAQMIPIADFDRSGLEGWYRKKFAGETSYALEPSPGGGMALHAQSRASASGYCKDVAIDLTRTPFVSWSWRMDRGPEKLDERSKEGDDHPLRLYFVHRNGWFDAQVVQYAWSLSLPAGTGWYNPFTDRVYQIAVDSGTKQAGTFLSHGRDLRADFATAFHIDTTRIDTVCLMTDSDNSHGEAEAWYGNVTFGPLQQAQ